jgi:hypothetical protein
MGTTTRYWLDGLDVMVRVNEGWTEFALENHAPQLLPERVLGHSLWEFLDDETRSVYQLLFRRVRTAGKATALRMRCDAPELRRHMELVIAPEADEGLAIACETLATYPITYSPDTPVRVGEFVRVCSWCNRVAVSDDEWVDVELAMPRLGLLEQYPVPNLTHGVCEECGERLNSQILACK